MLRRHINPLESPIYRLPLDLFPEIASHLTNETDLVNATHVSYHLRNTLLSHPTLWSHLDFQHERRAQAFFERSGQTPLHVDMPWSTNLTTSSLVELCQQSKRVATLNLRDWSVQYAFLSELLPSLKKLEISAHRRGSFWDANWDTSWAPMWGDGKSYFVVFSLFNVTRRLQSRPRPVLHSTPHLLQVLECGAFDRHKYNPRFSRQLSFPRTHQYPIGRTLGQAGSGRPTSQSSHLYGNHF